MNSITRLSITSLIITLSIISAYLTFEFTSNLSTQHSLVFGVTGVLLDLIKSALLPTLFILLLNKHQHVLAIMTATLGLLLVAMSFFASYSTLEQANQVNLEQSHEYQKTSSVIARKGQSLQLLHDQHQAQLSANQITNAAKTQLLITATERELTDLESTLTNTTGDTLLIKHGDTIALTLSGMIELTTILLVLAQSVLKPTPAPIQTLQTPQQPKSIHVPQSNQVQALAIEPAKYDDVRASILARETKPSYRSIGERFGMNRQEIKLIIESLNADGLLKPYRNGFTLA